MKKQTIFYFILLLMNISAELAAQTTTPFAVEWSVAGTLPPAGENGWEAGVAGPVAGESNGVLLVAGGANFPAGMPWLGGLKKYYRQGMVFSRTPDDSLVQKAHFSLPHSRAYSASCSTPEGIVAAGGENEEGLHNTVWLLQWNKATQEVDRHDLPPLPFAVANASLVFYENHLYLAGGEKADDVSDELWQLSLADTASGWQLVMPLPKPVSHAVMVVQGGALYLIGGRKRNRGSTSDLYASVYRLDLATRTWHEKSPLPYPLSAGTGMAVDDKAILVFGGDAGETFHQTESLIAAISKEKREAKKEALLAKKTNVQENHPGFCRQVFLYQTGGNTWQKLSCLPYKTPVTTTAIPWRGDVFIPSGEIKAGVRTPAILLGKINGIRKG